MRISQKSHISLIFLLAALIFITGCIGNQDAKGQYTTQEQAGDTKAGTSQNGTTWMTVPITDAITGETTTILDLASQNKTIIMHTFAVWCPACSMQLRETAKLVHDDPDSYIVLGVDIDPRENTDMIKNHAEKNKFTGIFIAAPPEMTRSLMNTVGNEIIRSLPQTIIICNKSATYIGDGVFQEQKLKGILSEIC